MCGEKATRQRENRGDDQDGTPLHHASDFVEAGESFLVQGLN
jgi:hypothetical protein